MFHSLYYCCANKDGFSVCDYHSNGIYYTFTFGMFGVSEHNEVK